MYMLLVLMGILAVLSVIGVALVTRCVKKSNSWPVLSNYQYKIKCYLELSAFYEKFSGNSEYASEADVTEFMMSTCFVESEYPSIHQPELRELIDNYYDELLAVELCNHARSIGDASLLTRSFSREMLITYRHKIASIIEKYKNELLAEEDGLTNGQCKNGTAQLSSILCQAVMGLKQRALRN